MSPTRTASSRISVAPGLYDPMRVHFSTRPPFAAGTGQDRRGLRRGIGSARASRLAICRPSLPATARSSRSTFSARNAAPSSRPRPCTIRKAGGYAHDRDPSPAPHGMLDITIRPIAVAWHLIGERKEPGMLRQLGALACRRWLPPAPMRRDPCSGRAAYSGWRYAHATSSVRRWGTSASAVSCTCAS